MSNLKIDIIYYKTSSDFEMEFNLSGCCRMRIFKDKVDTPRGLVNTLARDVARSKIIILVTDLFGEDCGIPVLAKAISLPLVSPNKEEFGIRTSENIRIPETAVPLVTKTGIYGGCIIESGPQSIIIVSGVRSLRHEIMKAYVHNYVFDVGQLMAYRERMGQSAHSAMPPLPNMTPTPEAPAANTFSADENATAQQDILPEASESDATVPDTAENVVEDLSSSSESVAEVASSDVQDISEEELSPETPTQDDDFPEAPEINEAPETTKSEDLEPEEDEPVSDLEAAIKAEIEKEPKPENTPKRTVKRPVQPGISAVDSLDFDQKEVDELYKKSRKKRKTVNIILLIVVILLLICFGILAYFFVYLPLIGADNGIMTGNSFVDFLSSLFG